MFPEGSGWGSGSWQVTCVHHHGDQVRGDTLPRACLPITHSRPWGGKVSLLRAGRGGGRLGLMIFPRNKADQGQEPGFQEPWCEVWLACVSWGVQLEARSKGLLVVVLG